MKKYAKQCLCIFVLAGSILCLIYIYLASPLYEGIKLKTPSPKINIKTPPSVSKTFDIKPVVPITAAAVAAKPSPSSGSGSFKPCSSITGTQEECTNNYYGSGSGNQCVYDTVNKRCIRPTQEYNPDGSIIDDGTNAPEERITEVQDVDMKSGI